MSVKEFGAPGHWTLNYSGIAYSTDGGHTWTKDPAVTWPGDSNFGQAALVIQDGYIYEFGIPGGRYGSPQLARVPSGQVLDKAAYQDWTGQRWVTNDPAAAVDVILAPVGELSVRWNSYYHRWIMMYLNDPAGQIVLRTAAQLTARGAARRGSSTHSRTPACTRPSSRRCGTTGPISISRCPCSAGTRSI